MNFIEHIANPNFKHHRTCMNLNSIEYIECNINFLEYAQNS